MTDTRSVVVAMARQYKRIISTAHFSRVEIPKALRVRHLSWMVDRVIEHSEDWPETRLHRWIGFIQSGMMANATLGLDVARDIFTTASNTVETCNDNLIDHLDFENTYSFVARREE